jgi:hypothetical protein
MIFTYQIDQSLIDIAQAKADEMGVLKNSFTGGDGNVSGLLGELVFMDFFGGVIVNTYNWDIEINGRKVEVKTKRTNYIPDEKYRVAVYAHNVNQKCDSYYFIRLNMDQMIAYLLGGLPKKRFYELAEFHRKGEIDPDNDWPYKADCYNVFIAELRQPKNYWPTDASSNSISATGTE